MWLLDFYGESHLKSGGLAAAPSKTMTDPITTIELDAVEQSTCQHKACNDQATRVFAVNGMDSDGPAIAGYCRYHQLNFARQSNDHKYLGVPKRPSDFSEVSVTDD